MLLMVYAASLGLGTLFPAVSLVPRPETFRGNKGSIVELGCRDGSGASHVDASRNSRHRGSDKRTISRQGIVR